MQIALDVNEINEEEQTDLNGNTVNRIVGENESDIENFSSDDFILDKNYEPTSTDTDEDCTGVL